MHLVRNIYNQKKNLRAALHMHGANLRQHPAHGLQGGVVVRDLHTAPHEVLLLEDDHATALVGLVTRGKTEVGVFGFLGT